MPATFIRTRAAVVAAASAIAAVAIGTADPAAAQTTKPAIAVTSIDLANDTVVITNSGSDPFDVNGLIFCNFPVYVPIAGADVVPAGGTITVDAGALGVALDDTQGELGVYLRSDFADPDAIVSYVEWGTADHQRSPVAVAAGIWDGSPVPAAPVLTATVATPTSSSQWTAGSTDSAPETTVAPTTAAPAAPAGDLPETGVETWLLVLLAVGAALLAVGVATLRFSSRGGARPDAGSGW